MASSHIPRIIQIAQQLPSAGVPRYLIGANFSRSNLLQGAAGSAVTTVKSGRVATSTQKQLVNDEKLADAFQTLALSSMEMRLSATRLVDRKVSVPNLQAISRHAAAVPAPAVINWIDPRHTIEIRTPTSRKVEEQEAPSRSVLVELIEPVLPTISREDPTGQIIEKKAAKKIRMLKIRKLKMKKHKLKKLRQKMKFDILKKRRVRELRKEKEFQESQMVRLRAAESFSAENHVKQILDEINRVVLPTRIRGIRRPRFVIEAELEEKREIKRKIKEKTFVVQDGEKSRFKELAEQWKS